MSEVRRPGNPGGTRGQSNAPLVSQPRASENSDAKAPSGETKFGQTPPRVGGRKGNPIH